MSSTAEVTNWQNPTGHRRTRSIGTRVASLVVVIVIFAAIAPSILTVILATREIDAKRANLATNHVKVLAGKFEEIVRYTSSLPKSITDAYDFEELLSSPSDAPQSSLQSDAEQLRKLQRIFNSQILQVQLLREISLLSASLGGREVLRIGWRDGRPTLFQADTLNIAPSIPFFLDAFRHTGTPALRIIKPDDLHLRESGEFRLDIGASVSNSDGVPVGVMMVTCDLASWLKESFNAESAGQKVFIADIEGHILYFSGDNQKLFFPDMKIKELWPGLDAKALRSINAHTTYRTNTSHFGIRPFVIHEDMLDGNHGKFFIGLISPAESSIYANWQFILIICAFTLFAAAISTIFVKHLTKPIVRVTEFARRIARGETDVDVLNDANNSSETRILASALFTMRQSIEQGAVAVREAALRLNIATNAANMGIWENSYQGEGGYFWSDEMYRLLGYDPGKTAVTANIIQHIPVEHREQFQSEIDGALRTNKKLKTEVTMLCRDGASRWFSIVAQPEISQDGTPIRLIGAAQDIHDFRMAENIKSEFVSIVSHELRTPMTSIIGSLTLVNSKKFGELPDKAAHLLSIAEKNALRLLRLINEILDIEKMLKSQTQLNRDVFDIRVLIETAQEQNTPYCCEYGVSLDIDGELPPACVSADFDRMIQVLTNLISNAAKFSPKGASVKLAAHCQDNKVCLSVSDSGPGIPEDFRDHVFDPFAQADSSDTRKIGGSGLGLTIARSIVNLHDGDIWFETGSDGTTFLFDLPICEDRPVATPVRQISQKATRILAVENDADLISLLREYLPKEITLTHADTIPEAIEVIENEDFDMYLLDLGFPGVRGERLLEMLLERDIPPERINIYSAYINPDYDYPPGLSLYTKSTVGLEALARHIEQTLG